MLWLFIYQLRFSGRCYFSHIKTSDLTDWLIVVSLVSQQGWWQNCSVRGEEDGGAWDGVAAFAAEHRDPRDNTDRSSSCRINHQEMRRRRDEAESVGFWRPRRGRNISECVAEWCQQMDPRDSEGCLFCSVLFHSIGFFICSELVCFYVLIVTNS